MGTRREKKTLKSEKNIKSPILFTPTDLKFNSFNFRENEKNMANKATEFKDYEWMMEEGADEKLEREIEEQLKFAELERMMLQEEAEAGDLQMLEQMEQLKTNNSSVSKFTPQITKHQLNVNAAVFVPSWQKG